MYTGHQAVTDRIRTSAKQGHFKTHGFILDTDLIEAQTADLRMFLRMRG